MKAIIKRTDNPGRIDDELAGQVTQESNNLPNRRIAKNFGNQKIIDLRRKIPKTQEHNSYDQK